MQRVANIFIYRAVVVCCTASGIAPSYEWLTDMISCHTGRYSATLSLFKPIVEVQVQKEKKVEMEVDVTDDNKNIILIIQ